MRKITLFLTVLIMAFSSRSQDLLDSLVTAGIKFHDKGNYEEAIEVYKKALEIDPISPLVNYEIAMTYMYAEQYEKSIEHCDIVLDQDDQYLLETYMTKGSSLDYLGKKKEAVKLFKKALKKFGDNYLLYYNLGYNYYTMGEYDDAEEAIINAIENNAGHASSHMLLGYLMSDKNQQVQSLLALHYFLLLEPNTNRSENAYKLLREEFGGNTKKGDGNQITIYVDPDQMESEFGTASLMISMFQATNSAVDEELGRVRTEDESFINNSSSLFQTLAGMKEKKNSGLYWDFYIPFFNDIAESDHMEAYCYYIMQSSNENAVKWLEENPDKLSAFGTWLSEE